MNNSQTIEYRNEQNREKRDNMKYFILSILVCIGVNTCILKQNAGNKHTISIIESNSQITYSNSISKLNCNDTINKRYDDLNKLGIDSILIELNYPKYGEIFLSASDSYSQKDDYRDYCPKYTIDEYSWKILLDGINKFVVLKEPFLVKKVKRSDGLIVAVDYPTYLNIYIDNNVLSSKIEKKTEEFGEYIYRERDYFKKWYKYIYSLIYH